MIKYLPTILVGLVVLALAALSIASLLKNRKNGKCSCGCATCPYTCAKARPKRKAARP